MLNLLSVIPAISLIYFAFQRGLVYLHLLQQDEYSPERLLTWIKSNKAFDRRGSVLCLSIFLISLIFKFYSFFILLGGLALALLSFLQCDPRRLAKVPLKMTSRANKIFLLYLSFFTLLTLLITTLNPSGCRIIIFLNAIILIQLIPFLLMLAVKTLAPAEKYLQNRYLAEAKTKFRKVNPLTIAITGSFGKTSVKTYLAEVLQTVKGATFWPTGGTNTLMGVTKEIRENLSPFHQIAVIEAGAYRPGSIARVCELTPPKISIITAIGAAHLERFGNLDVTYQAKTEIARALPVDGILICNGDDELAAKAGTEILKGKNIIYGFGDSAKINCRGKDLKFSNTGSSFTIIWEGKTYDIKTKLLGRTAASNLLAVFAAAVSACAKPELVSMAFSALSPVSNRLALNKRGNFRFLDDAYNSNETGFKAALEVMHQIDATQKIVITPGVIELGEQQFEVNKTLGQMATAVADYLIVVSTTNRAAFQAGADKNKVFFVDNREQAFAKLNEIGKIDALVLLENDLTDLHEHDYKF